MSETMVIWRRTGERQEVEATIFHSSERALVFTGVTRPAVVAASTFHMVAVGANRPEHSPSIVRTSAKAFRLRSLCVAGVSTKSSDGKIPDTVIAGQANMVVLRCVWQRPLAW